MTVNILETELFDWVNAPAGPIARWLEEVAENIVVPDAQEALSVPHGFLAARGELNPPPGPPRKRTGDLISSIKVVPAVSSQGVTGEIDIAVYVVSDADHDGLYAPVLLGQGYHFLPDRDYYDFKEV